MQPDLAVIELRPEQFDVAERVLARFAGLTASTFRYRSGVAGLRIANAVGHIVLLPFQGQQIWDAVFRGRRLTMGSMFEEPVDTLDYLANYGGFFIHCGATAMGNPGPGDRHPLHGELPNAPYRQAELLIGSDENGPFMGLSGCYRHTVAFTHNYEARPTVRIGAASSAIFAELSVRNLKRSPMELMYLAHINFRPVDGATIVDSVPDDPAHIRLRTTLPQGFPPNERHRQLIEAITADLASHRLISPGRAIEPELVMALDCRADAAGWAHAAQILPDGTADFVSHRPDELSHAVRWMTRSGDQEAVGVVLPATAEADGYTAEKAKGNVRLLPPGGAFSCRLQFGALEAAAAARFRKKIEEARGAHHS
jgi:hypothetical protein